MKKEFQEWNKNILKIISLNFIYLDIFIEYFELFKINKTSNKYKS
jgi:hypothetical protein